MGFIKLRYSSLMAFLFVLVMLPRPLVALGAPTMVNFLHFPVVALLSFIIALNIKTVESKKLILGIAGFVTMVVFSAIYNYAGYINIILDVLILVEPFLFLVGMTAVEWKPVSISAFRRCLIFVGILHIFMAFYQRIILGLWGDDVEGLFVNMGAGSHLAGAVALAFGLYLFSMREFSSVIRVCVFIACILVLILSDAKQVILVSLLSLVLLSLFKMKNYKVTLSYLATLIVFGGLGYYTILLMYPSLTWLNPEIMVMAIEQKLSVFGIIVNSFDSIGGWFFGLGPGHSIGRLAWMLPEYQYLMDLGATISYVTQDIIDANQSNWMSNSITGSSLFSLMFSWAGIFGDFGFAGLLAYLYVWFLVWKYYSQADLSRFFVLGILIFGAVFSWIEEPGYILFIMAIIGLSWQENQSLGGVYSFNNKKLNKAVYYAISTNS